MTEKFQCIVVDDEPLARELIESYLNQLDQFHLVASCATALEASTHLKSNAVDLIFLDIEMPVLNGVDFYRTLPQDLNVIFTTAYRDYAVEGFELHALDYLLKPITFARFFKSVERFIELNTQTKHGPSSSTPAHTQKTHILVRSDRKDVKIRLTEITYIQSLKDYIIIHASEKKHVVKDSIAAFQNKLSTNFLRVHRSYIVNCDHITAFTKHDIEIGDIEIPIGETFRAELAQYLKTIR